jgi:decaprenylphospho-beta-D-erythro-pentofuranosid-2-ulose 2-reductase
VSYVLILGSTSDIAKATARVYANNGYDLYLTARNIKAIETFASEIRLKYNQAVKSVELDILDYESHFDFYAKLPEKPLGVICAIGYLGNQLNSQVDFLESRKIIDTNFTGIVSLLNVIANDFELRNQGFIVGISSVAGERGRKSNYTYGSVKAALTSYLSGLRNRLNNSQVHVMTVKPGYVLSGMTKNLKLPQSLTILPDDMAKRIFKAQQKNINILFTKSIWRWIVLIIKCIPEWKFKKMNI